MNSVIKREHIAAGTTAYGKISRALPKAREFMEELQEIPFGILVVQDDGIPALNWEHRDAKGNVQHKGSFAPLRRDAAGCPLGFSGFKIVI